MKATRPIARRLRCAARRFAIAVAAAIGLGAAGCDYVDTPYTYVVLDNHYPAATPTPLAIYRAYWQAVTFKAPVPPGSSSAPMSTVAASANTAWVVLAPGWDPSSSAPPTSFVVLESREGFSVNLDDTLQIPVDDADFDGNCAAGSRLTQSQADFITTLVFPSVFHGLHYDAATCTVTRTAVEGGTP